MRAARSAFPAADVLSHPLLRGILLMCFSVFLAASMNAIVKYLAPYHDASQVLWARYLVGTMIVLAIFLPRRGVAVLRSHSPGLQLMRAVLIVVSAWLFFASLKYLPIAMAATISLTGPFYVTVLAALFLKERVGLHRWAAIVLGCAGAVIAVQPGSVEFHWAVFLTLAANLCFAIFQLLTRRVGSLDSPETSTVFVGLVAILTMSFVVPFFWTTPISLLHWGLILLSGIIGAASQFYLARALQLAPASSLSPFHYTHIVFATIFGFLIFSEIPTIWVGLGAALIVMSGHYSARKEQTDRRGDDGNRDRTSP